MTTGATQERYHQELASGERFAFGANWEKFLGIIDERRIEDAQDSLRQMLEVQELSGKTFLDVGSGSGLFSLAARRLGAKVVSFDYDPQSVACTSELKRRYFKDDANWSVASGSVLDPAHLQGLGRFDIVYSWGVLHHTGNMWAALSNIDLNVDKGGKLFISIYNYQPFATKYWTFVKKLYNKAPLVRPLLILAHAVYPTLPSVVLRFVQRRRYPRGMSVWRDLHDWLGGYPFEVATPAQIFEHYKAKGYMLTKLKTVGGKLGCNEFVFQRSGVYTG